MIHTEIKNGRSGWNKMLLLAVMDVLCVLFAYFFAMLLRFDFSFTYLMTTGVPYVENYLLAMPLWCALTLAVFYFFRLYHGIWRLASVADLEAILKAYVTLIPCYALYMWGMGRWLNVWLPKSVYIMGYLINFCLTAGSRFSFRILKYLSGNMSRYMAKQTDRIMVIGAGSAGQILIRELRNSANTQMKVCCVIDDNPVKLGKQIEGVEIVGNRHDIVNMAKKHDITRIVYSIPSASPEDRKQILNLCKETNCRLQTIPGMSQILNDEVSITRLRDVEVTDLLGRDQVRVNNEEIFADIAGKVILVTGGGGSIGSELCRQIARANPRRLIIFDVYENNAYAIQQELVRSMPDLDLVTLIGSVRNTNRIQAVMRTYRPDIVFHAAAHKHVPLMEDSPNEAIKNNVIGTWKTARAAAEHGVQKFVLISTDKAVNPTNIMGASKRLCEMVVQMMDRKSDTRFVAVRFGNVLGSNGSVIPLFKKQIAEGGPVTVTDKRIIRYFMTIPEAVALVLQASYYAGGGEIFVLEMGEPVKIDDMARNLIRLSGYTPDVDIKIVYTGLRPGEKLYEEMLMDEEGLRETANKLIHIGKPIEMDDDWFCEKLRELDEASREESDRIRQLVSEVVPTYQYQQQKETANLS